MPMGHHGNKHILGGFCGFLRQPVLLGILQVQAIWVGKPSPGMGGLTQWVGVVFAYVRMHVSMHAHLKPGLWRPL